MSYIPLVRGDTGPQVKVTLTDETSGDAMDITGATIYLHFRAADTTEVLSTLTGSIVSGPAGTAVFEWEEDTLDVPEGSYEGEIEVVFANGMRQTVFALVAFAVREHFA